MALISRFLGSKILVTLSAGLSCCRRWQNYVWTRLWRTREGKVYLNVIRTYVHTIGVARRVTSPLYCSCNWQRRKIVSKAAALLARSEEKREGRREREREIGAEKPSVSCALYRHVPTACYPSSVTRRLYCSMGGGRWRPVGPTQGPYEAGGRRGGEGRRGQEKQRKKKKREGEKGSGKCPDFATLKI